TPDRGQIYALGGSGFSGTLRTVEVQDAATRTWNTARREPTGTRMAECAKTVDRFMSGDGVSWSEGAVMTLGGLRPAAGTPSARAQAAAARARNALAPMYRCRHWRRRSGCRPV